MAASIGVRIYTVTLHAKGQSKPVSFDYGGLAKPLPNFVDGFINGHLTPTRNDVAERSWYFEVKNREENSNKGYLHYGTFGFESNFVDTKTKEHNYRRKTTDVEEIPLFYEFWFPSGSNTAFIVFQSFQGRSCISMVLSGLKEQFESANSAVKIIFTKIMPSKFRGAVYGDADIKKLKLIKKNVSSDIASKYFSSGSSDVMDYEVSFSARRKGFLGKFGDLASKFKTESQGLIMHQGIKFDEAIAEIRVGNRLRRVGVMGRNSDAGVIDLSTEIERGQDGHPTFESLVEETDALLQDFYSTLKGVGS